MFKRRKKRDETIERLIATIDAHCKKAKDCLSKCAESCECNCYNRKKKGDGDNPSPSIIIRQ